MRHSPHNLKAESLGQALQLAERRIQLCSRDARQLNADPGWAFLTGDLDYIRRVGSEFLGMAGGSGHHSSLLTVIDRWGEVRGRFDWQIDGEKQKMLELIDQLNAETRPAASFEVLETETGEDLP